MTIAIISLVISLLLPAYFCCVYRKRMAFAFSLMAVSMSSYHVLYQLFDPNTLDLLSRAHYFALFIMPAFLFLFLADFFFGSMTNFIRFMLLWSLSLSILCWVVDEVWMPRVLTSFHIAAGLTFIYVNYLGFREIKQHSWYKVTAALGIYIFVGAGVHDSLVARGILDEPRLSSAASLLWILIIFFALDKKRRYDLIRQVSPPVTGDSILDGKTALVVDDDNFHVQLMRAFLQPAPLTVLSTTSAADALAILKAHPVDILITDYHMPEFKGAELIRYCRDNKPHIACLSLSGDISANAVAELNEAGALKTLYKPITRQELRAHIIDAYRQAQARVKG